MSRVDSITRTKTSIKSSSSNSWWYKAKMLVQLECLLIRIGLKQMIVQTGYQTNALPSRLFYHKLRKTAQEGDLWTRNKPRIRRMRDWWQMGSLSYLLKLFTLLIKMVLPTLISINTSTIRENPLCNLRLVFRLRPQSKDQSQESSLLGHPEVTLEMNLIGSLYSKTWLRMCWHQKV